MITDPISDMLTRIRNAQSVGKQNVSIPYSRVKEHIVSVLQEEGYVRSYSLDDSSKMKNLIVDLKYYDGKPVIYKIERCSKPGRRVYSPISDLPFVANGLGMSILSTSKGMMSDTKARSFGIGGEVICRVL